MYLVSNHYRCTTLNVIKYIKRFALYLVDTEIIIDFSYKPFKKKKTQNHYIEGLNFYIVLYYISTEKLKPSIRTFPTVYAVIADNSYYQREFCFGIASLRFISDFAYNKATT